MGAVMTPTARRATKYRTSGVAVFDLSDSWAEARSATLSSFVTPR